MWFLEDVIWTVHVGLSLRGSHQANINHHYENLPLQYTENFLALKK